MRQAPFYLLCAVAGLLFFASLPVLWPLVPGDLTANTGDTERTAREFLIDRGFSVEQHRAARSWAMLRETDHVDRTLGRSETQARIAAGLPVTYWRVDFKKRGETTGYTVRVHPSGSVVGWFVFLDEDEPGARIEANDARELALRAAESVGVDRAVLEEKSATLSELSERRDHSFLFQRTLSEEPELHEWVTVRVSGDQVTTLERRVRIPPEARRRERARAAPMLALEAAGYGLLALVSVCGLFVFLRRLQAGTVRLAAAAFWPGVVFVCLLGTLAFQQSDVLAAWEPLWPRWVSLLRYLVFNGIAQLGLPVLLLMAVGAGDSLDETGGHRRGVSLSLLRRGKWLAPEVTAASWRGFLVGLLCGGVLAASVRLVLLLPGARIALQPRHFFNYPLDSAAPALITLLFFLGIALAEELGYRYFAGAWLDDLTGRRWLAIWLPALVYGLAHTNLGFLPPADPFWARAAVMTLVGAVWGWAFFRFDALTVVLSHFTADLFIFNWPRMAGGDPWAIAASFAVVCVPLIPAALGLLARAAGHRPQPAS